MLGRLKGLQILPGYLNFPALRPLPCEILVETLPLPPRAPPLTAPSTPPAPPPPWTSRPPDNPPPLRRRPLSRGPLLAILTLDLIDVQGDSGGLGVGYVDSGPSQDNL